MRVAVFHTQHAAQLTEQIGHRFPELEITPCHDETTARHAVAEADILVCQMTFPGQLLAEAPRMRWVQALSAGVEKLLPWLPEGVRLSRLTGSFGPRMAEYTAAYLLAITQRVPAVLANQRAKRWEPLTVDVAHGKTAGIAGLGSIGAAHVRLLAALGLETIGFSQRPPALPELRRWYGRDEWHAFLRAADFVVLCLPLTAETRHVVDATALAAMRFDAWLINTARGGLVDEAALVAALRAGRLGGAVLDVFETEPLPPESPLWGLPNVIVTPHHSGPTTLDEAVAIVVENLPRFQAGQPLRNEVDPGRGY